MRIDGRALVLSVGLVVAASACGSVLQEPADGGRGDGGVVPCRELGEAACLSRSDCSVNGCAPCSGGGSGFINCIDPTVDGRVACGACPQVPCSSLTEAGCSVRPDCRADACPSCNGNPAPFARCTTADDPSHACLTILCPEPCASYVTQEACEAQPTCHAVFIDDRACACAGLGCCTHFSRCADGGTAICQEPAIVCDAVAPRCEGPYVVGYSSGCYEGCVLASDCIVL